jgi:hypothetical protein
MSGLDRDWLLAVGKQRLEIGLWNHIIRALLTSMICTTSMSDISKKGSNTILKPAPDMRIG